LRDASSAPHQSISSGQTFCGRRSELTFSHLSSTRRADVFLSSSAWLMCARARKSSKVAEFRIIVVRLIFVLRN